MKMDVCLKRLVSDWAFRRDREVFATAFLENPRVPAVIQAQITNVEPFRALAIEDARLHYALPMPFGFGMEIYFPDSVTLFPFQNWKKTIHNLTVQVEYCERMDGTDCYRYGVKIQRIGREDGDWKIIEVFDETERAEIRKAFLYLKNLRAEKKDN
jgi:hypothetical protein